MIICIATGTRAEYGLLRPLIARIASESGMELRLLATGSHLSGAFGYTCREIEADGYKIDAKIEMLLSSDTAAGMAKSTGLGMISFADYFAAGRPDMLVVLGDRFEIFAAASAAAMMRIPIAHISGGDTSEGAIDEFLRHSITKMSTLHFPSNGQSAGRIIQMGESPERVFNVGALHVECIRDAKLLSREELADALCVDSRMLSNYVLLTYHPATLAGAASTSGAASPGASPAAAPAAAPTAALGELKTILRALARFPGMGVIATKSNADSGGRAINDMLDAYQAQQGKSTNGSFKLFASLGARRYLSAMSHAAAVVGNSSSGLYEAPVLGVPAVNIGDRQKGRLCPVNVINCAPVFDDIVSSLKIATSEDFASRAAQAKTQNPYGDGSASRSIVGHIKAYLEGAQAAAPPAKSFHDILLA